MIHVVISTVISGKFPRLIYNTIKLANDFALVVGLEPTTHGLVSMNVLATFCLRVILKFLSRLFPCTQSVALKPS